MTILDINGEITKVSIKESDWPRRNKNGTREKKIREVLDEHFPFDIILEQFVVPGTRLTVDFYIPKKKMVVEVQGAQHFEYTSFFHGQKNKMKFVKQQIRDQQKASWCDLNGFRLIEIFPKETEEEIIVKFKTTTEDQG